MNCRINYEYCLKFSEASDAFISGGRTRDFDKNSDMITRNQTENVYTSKEIDEFLNSLTSGQFRNIQNFFDTMPKLTKEVTAKCTSCGKKNTKVLEGLADFF